jgi:transcriptional regulator with XRE-family HTH domain
MWSNSLYLTGRKPQMTSRATTLGAFVAELMQKQRYTNRALAAAAGISEGAVRNILKFGVEADARDPEARTLQLVAQALGINPLRLYRMAGYLPPTPDVHSVRAEFVADIFDHLTFDQQQAILSVLDTMVKKPDMNQTIQEIRENPSDPLAGFDLQAMQLIRLMANELIAKYDITEVVDLNRIEPEAQLFNYQWKNLPVGTQERVKALIKHKLALDYDPTMVDPKWRK